MNEKSSLGYTLVELLIVLVIMSALFVGGYTSYREFARRQALNSEQGLIKDALSVARQLALSGEKPSQCSSSSTLNGYSFELSSRSYAIRPSCTLSDGTAVTGVLTVRTGQMSSDIDMTLNTGSTIFFKTLSGENDNVNDYVITIRKISTGDTQTISVSPQGVIE